MVDDAIRTRRAAWWKIADATETIVREDCVRDSEVDSAGIRLNENAVASGQDVRRLLCLHFRAFVSGRPVIPGHKP